MVVEHEFVTTAEPSAAMASAASFLGDGGFAPEQTAFQVGQAQWTTLDMRRGKKNPAKAKSICELPQRVLVQYDRGRVTVAASITASQVWGGRSGLSTGAAAESSKKMVLHQQMLVAIASGLEGVLADGQSPELARTSWVATEAVIVQAARKRRNRSLIALLVVFGLLLAVAIVVWVAASR